MIAYSLYLRHREGDETKSVPTGKFASLGDVNSALIHNFGKRKDAPWELRHAAKGIWHIYDIAERLRGTVMKTDALHGEYVYRSDREQPILDVDVTL